MSRGRMREETVSRLWGIGVGEGIGGEERDVGFVVGWRREVSGRGMVVALAMRLKDQALRVVHGVYRSC